jgi:hypothetical protein
MKYNHLGHIVKHRECIIRGDILDIEQLKPEDIKIVDKDEEPEKGICKIIILDGKPLPTVDALKAKYKQLMDAEPMRLLRIERTKRLETTDYKFKPDYKHKSNTHRRIWEEYRQYLRDLPQTSTPALTDNGDLSFNFMYEPDDNKIIPDEKDDPIPITNEDLLSENLKMKEDLKKMKTLIASITEQIGILRYADSE